jgi:hypothetical protein
MLRTANQSFAKKSSSGEIRIVKTKPLRQADRQQRLHGHYRDSGLVQPALSSLPDYVG